MTCSFCNYSPTTAHLFSIQGFRYKEFRPKLALAITANFVNNFTKEDNRAEEISGVSYIYHQNFFKELKAKHNIDLENIVYYRGETHYFIFSIKKHSLLDKGVFKQVGGDC